jgi:phage tail protein X
MPYITTQGDTFDIISKNVYSDEAFVGNIINANPQYMNTVMFSAGVELIIPPKPEPSIADNLPPWVRGIQNG